MQFSYLEDYRLTNGAQRVMCALLAIFALILPHLVDAQFLELANRAFIASVAAISLNLLTGTCGLISIGHAGFLALGGLVAAILSNLGWMPFPLVMLCTILAGALVGFLVGLPAVRLRGLYLVLATLGFQYLFLYGIRSWQSTLSSVAALTGLALPAPHLGFLTVKSPIAWYYFLIIILLGAVLISINLVRSYIGRAWIALRDNELVAAAMGINVPGQKLIAFMVSSAMASFAGGLLAYYNGTFSADLYTIELSVIYFVMIILGGLGSVTGAILGAIFVTVIPTAITALTDILGIPMGLRVLYVAPAELITYGAMIVLIPLLWPHGLMSLVEAAKRFIATWPLGNFASRAR
jgi:branched-chain amino acid transport system permease protein